MQVGRHGEIPQSVCMADRIRNYIESYDKKSKTPMDEECKEKALELYQKIRSDGGLIINGQNPRVIASTLIYIAGVMIGDLNITQEQVSKVMNVTVVSMRNKLPKLLKFFGEKYRHQEEYESVQSWDRRPDPVYWVEHANEWRLRSKWTK